MFRGLLLTQLLDTMFPSLLRDNTFIRLELARRDTVMEHLVYLFQRTIFSLRNKEENKDSSDDI